MISSVTQAQSAIDDIGIAEAGDLVGRIVEAAFPEAKGAESGNPKGASRKG